MRCEDEAEKSTGTYDECQALPDNRDDRQLIIARYSVIL